jgi:hypothetical protein
MPRQKSIQSKTVHADHWDNHEIVCIRGLTGYDSDWIQDQMMTQAAGQDMAIKIGTAQRLTLIRCIESWTFTDYNNNPIPWPPLSINEADNGAICKMREQSLAQVFPDDRAYIYGEINAINQPMKEDEKKGSSMNGNAGSHENTHGHQSQLSIAK